MQSVTVICEAPTATALKVVIAAASLGMTTGGGATTVQG
eukprot:CAMPEP_0171681336 /NCGR_PEP_ID=MMETSP0990-20121206/57315_1 /TAXON_ID=483369 /ORGANISM="non described non described, Strain CCMP2098" /LENGTH=38 /DNA_ID= /DNA_START= /DNA_END= /DNA_ORIENTATION=